MKNLKKACLLQAIKDLLSWEEAGFSKEEAFYWGHEASIIRSYTKEELMEEISFEQIQNNEIYWLGFEEDLDREVLDKLCEELEKSGYVIEK